MSQYDTWKSGKAFFQIKEKHCCLSTKSKWPNIKDQKQENKNKQTKWNIEKYTICK